MYILDSLNPDTRGLYFATTGFPADTLEAIGERHNLRAGEISPLEDFGIFNAIYLIGSEYILRIPRDAPPFVAAIRKESVAVPAARAAGVRTPALARARTRSLQPDSV